MKRAFLFLPPLVARWNQMIFFKKVFFIFFISFLFLSVVVLFFMVFSPHPYKTERNFEEYFQGKLAEDSQNLPLSGWAFGPKTLWFSYDQQETEFIYLGRDGDPAWSYTEVYFAEGGRFLGYYQRLSTGSSYSDGFVPNIIEYTKITSDEFWKHVPYVPR